MTPRAFLERYRFDERMVTGRFHPTDRLEIDAGDRIAVVLFNLGGPRSPEEVEPFLYNLFMDPAIIDIPLPAALRDGLCRFIARRRSATVREEYARIGGSSPINAHTERQATLLEQALNAAAAGPRFRVYRAMRYAPPSSEDAGLEMRNDGMTKVVLLPLYPQYSKTTTGASLAYWKALEETGEIPTLPTVAVTGYATHPDFVAAVNARIEEGLARFPEPARVTLLFSAHGTPLYEMTRRRDPYCGLVQSTVEHVMRERGGSHPHRLAFQSKVGPAKWLSPSTPDALRMLADEGCRDVLVVPIAFVSDHVETAFELDIEVRHQAHEFGIQRYEVMPGLNDHPLFIRALADVVRRHLTAGGSTVRA